MKKFLMMGFMIVLLLSACRKDNEPAPGDRPDERLSQLLTDYKTQLTHAEHGWKATLYPAGGAGYSFLIKFLPNDRMTMLADINATSASTPLESTYRLKAMQRPSLIFDTYNYMHILSDPDPRKSGGDVGEGRYSDFEFSFESVTDQAITLKGTQKGSKLILTKATQEEAQNYISKIATNAIAFEKINTFTTYFKRLALDQISFDVNAYTPLRIITFSYQERDQQIYFTTTYMFTADGLTLMEPFVVGDLTIKELKNIQFNEAENKIELVVNNFATSIKEEIKPAIISTQIAKTFYTSPPNGYYVTYEGFTIEGIRDSLKLRTIEGFQAAAFVSPGSTKPYDTFLVLTAEDYYGPFVHTQFPTDGRITFTSVAEAGNPPSTSFGTIPIPEQAKPILQETINQLTIPEGYYVVMTEQGYDLVSAKDAKAWISFY